MLVLGIDPDTREITGYYHEESGATDADGRPMFTCIFLFDGRAEGTAPYAIRTWMPGERGTTNDGQIAPDAHDPAKLVLTLTHEQGGCWNVEHFADPGGYDTTLDPGSWRAVRVVSVPRAHFHSAPGTPSRRAAYVTSGDVVRVYGWRDGWADAEFEDAQGGRTRGWLRSRDLLDAGSDAPSPTR
jgi:hypothetical protein